MDLSRSLAIGAASFALLGVPAVVEAQSVPDGITSVGASAAVAARDAVLTHPRLAPMPALQSVTLDTSASPRPAMPSGGGANEAVPPPITDADVSKPGFLGDRFTYEADLQANFQGGDTGRPNSNLPGGVDGSLIYRIGRTTRLAANYYQFSATALGSSDTKTPIVFQGTTTPIGYANLYQLGGDSTTHLRFQIYQIQQMFFVGGRHHPLVFAPAYASVRSIVAGRDDSGTIFANNQVETVHQRSYENKSLNLAVPLFYAENYLISYTGGVIWNMNSNGANLSNTPQYQQTLYAQYEPDDATTFFASAAKVVTYFPTDVYPYYSPTFHVGFARTIKKPLFFEGEISTGGPSNPNYTNIGRIGVADLTVPCPRTAAGGAPTLTCVALAQNGVAVPVVGAQRFTTFTFLLGIGNAPPLVQPF